MPCRPPSTFAVSILWPKTALPSRATLGGRWSRSWPAATGGGAALAAGDRFAAAVAFYPGCFTIKPASGRPYEVVNPDIDRPLLVLMGERDNETPPSECVPKLEAAKVAAAPVTWHVYPEATHSWDSKNLDGFSKVDFRGNQVVYRYDKDISADSARRMFDFLEKAMPVRP